MNVDLQACLNGDKQAWDDFVDRSWAVILAAVRRTIGGRAGEAGGGDVDDSVQEVYVRLLKDEYRLLKTYDPGRASLSTWLSLVARSVTIDHLRRKRPKTVPLEAGERPGPAPRSSEVSSLPLHCLSPRQRLVLRMLFDEDMSVAEAARMIGVDEQTIRSTKHKALRRMQVELSLR
ncbi:MAG: RNA polymerase sigma factor [Planctomycetota bacterium]|jgi:RNA polymerase sigma-70 factor (ECF subfamily)